MRVEVCSVRVELGLHAQPAVCVTERNYWRTTAAILMVIMLALHLNNINNENNSNYTLHCTFSYKHQLEGI